MIILYVTVVLAIALVAIIRFRATLFGVSKTEWNPSARGGMVESVTGLPPVLCAIVMAYDQDCTGLLSGNSLPFCYHLYSARDIPLSIRGVGDYWAILFTNHERRRAGLAVYSQELECVQWQYLPKRFACLRSIYSTEVKDFTMYVCLEAEDMTVIYNVSTAPFLLCERRMIARRPVEPHMTASSREFLPLGTSRYRSFPAPLGVYLEGSSSYLFRTGVETFVFRNVACRLLIDSESATLFDSRESLFDSAQEGVISATVGRIDGRVIVAVVVEKRRAVVFWSDTPFLY